MARLSTHVLDIAAGAPAEGVVIELHLVLGAERRHVETLTTNADGRTSRPLLESEAIATGVYELTFHAGDYFRAKGVPLSDPPFLDEIVIRFGIGDPLGRYHVPLLLAAHGYSTYRGS